MDEFANNPTVAVCLVREHSDLLLCSKANQMLIGSLAVCLPRLRCVNPGKV